MATASSKTAQSLTSQLAQLVPTFDPGVDSVEQWSQKIKLILKGHWRAEFPVRKSAESQGSGSEKSAYVAPTSAAVSFDLDQVPEISFENNEHPEDTHVCVFGLVEQRVKFFEEKFKTKLRAKLQIPVRKSRDACLPEVSAQASPSKSDSIEELPSLFASVGTTGVVDLGASQTVIGSEQVSELLNNLPSEIQRQARKTKCKLIFKFGNHQTLPSKVALLLPLQGTWIRIAIVEGKTPFLLSSSMKHVQAVIDTEKGTLWSKRLNRNLHMTQASKNLFLLDINQLWASPTSKQCSEPDSILIAKSSPQESHDEPTNPDRCVKTFRAAPAEVKGRESFDSQNFCKSASSSTVSESVSTHDMKHESKLEVHQPQSCAPSSSVRAVPGDPCCEPDHVRAVRSATSPPEATEGRRGPCRDRRDDVGRSRNTSDHVRQDEDGMQVPRSICRHPVDKICCEQIRELNQEGTPDVRPVCATPSRQDGKGRAQPGGSVLPASDTSGTYIIQDDRNERSHDCSEIQGQTKGLSSKCADLCSRS